MKLPRLLVVVLTALGLLVPTLGSGDQLWAPLEKKLPAGVTTFSYAQQTIRVSTPVPLVVRCDPISLSQIRVRVSVYGSLLQQGTDSPNQSSSLLNIYWVDYAADVYNGSLPGSGETVDVVLNTEGGFVDR